MIDEKWSGPTPGPRSEQAPFGHDSILVHLLED